MTPGSGGPGTPGTPGTFVFPGDLGRNTGTGGPFGSVQNTPGSGRSTLCFYVLISVRSFSSPPPPPPLPASEGTAAVIPLQVLFLGPVLLASRPPLPSAPQPLVLVPVCLDLVPSNPQPLKVRSSTDPRSLKIGSGTQSCGWN